MLQPRGGKGTGKRLLGVGVTFLTLFCVVVCFLVVTYRFFSRDLMWFSLGCSNVLKVYACFCGLCGASTRSLVVFSDKAEKNQSKETQQRTSNKETH